MVGLLDNMPQTDELMTLAALIDLKIKLAEKMKSDPRILGEIRAQYSRQGQKSQLITELGSLVFNNLIEDLPGVGFADSDIIDVIETVVSILKENKVMDLETAAEIILNENDYTLNSSLSEEHAMIIAENALFAMFNQPDRFSYLYEVHGDEAYSEDMAEVMKVSDNNEFARVLFINLARMLHLRYSVIFSERLRFMISQALKIVEPTFPDLEKPVFGTDNDNRTIRDILISAFVQSESRFRRLGRNSFLEESA